MPPATDVAHCVITEVKFRQTHGPDTAVVLDRCLELYQCYIVVMVVVGSVLRVCDNAFDLGPLFISFYAVQVMFTCEKTGVMTRMSLDYISCITEKESCCCK